LPPRAAAVSESVARLSGEPANAAEAVESAADLRARLVLLADANAAA
jgi:hypothetical protein